MKLTGSLYFAGLCVVVSLLTACGGGGGSSPATAQPVSEDIQIFGAGIKGPLAFADTKIYLLDPSFPEFYDPDSPISSAMTNASAQITGLSVPATTQPPYVLTIGGNLAIDLNTGKAPVISTLVTVITSDMLKANRPIYTTPLTTLAYHMARYNTGSKSFESKLKDAAPQITSLFSIDPAVAIDIFSSPLIIDASTVTVAEQEEAVHHRAALEAFAAKAYALSFLPENASADIVIDRLARDLQSDGVIDNAVNGTTIGGIDTTTVTRDPMGMTIPNTTYLVSDIVKLMSEERVLIGTESDSTFLVSDISLPVAEPVVVAPDSPVPTAPTEVPVQPTQSATLPIDLRNTTPEQANLTINVAKASDASTATVTMGAYDADHSSEGELIINGNAPVPLFGAQGVSANNSVSADISISTPASYWNNGDNTLVFRHTSSGGFIVENVTVSFQVASAPSPEPVLALSASSLNFGSQNIGTVSNASSVTLTNSGTASLTISSISATQDYMESNNCSSTIAVGGSCTINVSFIPTTSGSISGSLNIASDSQGSQNTVNLSGTGSSTTTTPSNLTPSGPIVINGEQGVVISGLHITNPNGSCIEVLNGSTNIVIENSEIGPCGKGADSTSEFGSGFGIKILSGSSDVTVRNNYIHDTWTVGVLSKDADRIAVDKNVMIHVWGGFKIWATSGGHMSFTNNFVKNLAPGPYTRWEDEPRGSPNVVQAVFVNGPAIRITDNVAINIDGESNVEDLVNLYESDGQASDPILIARNKFNGGKAHSGFGILLGDGSSPARMSSYAIAEDNILVNTGSGGLNIAGGRYNTARNNKIYGDVKDEPYPNVGLAVGGECSTQTVEYNEVTFYKGANWNNTGNTAYPFPAWGCSDVVGWSTNKFDTKSSQPAHLDGSLWNPAWNTPSFLPDNPYYYGNGAL